MYDVGLHLVPALAHGRLAEWRGEHLFAEMAMYYDLIYSAKDYRGEASRLLAQLRAHGWSGGGALLDVACGTGRHLEILREHFEVEGLDISDGLLESARRRNPGVVFHQADMVAFELGRLFDVVTCLFSAIGYVRDEQHLAMAVGTMARHLRPSGLLAIEPWFTPDAWRPGTVHAVLMADDPQLKVARLNTSFAIGSLSYFDLHYLVATAAGTEHFVEHHELGLFEHAQVRSAFLSAGLEPHFDEVGLTGRGLWIGRRGGVTADA